MLFNTGILYSSVLCTLTHIDYRSVSDFSTSFFLQILLLRVIIFQVGTYYKLYSIRIQVHILIFICLTTPLQLQWLYIIRLIIINP